MKYHFCDDCEEVVNTEEHECQEAYQKSVNSFLSRLAEAISSSDLDATDRSLN